MHSLALSIYYEIIQQHRSLGVTVFPSLVTPRNTEGTLPICSLGPWLDEKHMHSFGPQYSKSAF